MKFPKHIIAIAFVLLQFTKVAFSLEQPDTVEVAKILDKKVASCVSDGRHGLWIIAGDNRECLYHIDRRKRVVDIKAKYGIPRDERLTCLEYVNHRILFVGTSSRFLLRITLGFIVTIDARHGIPDSSIVGIKHVNHHLIVITNNGQYSSTNESMKRFDPIAPSSSIENLRQQFEENIQLPVQKMICDFITVIDERIKKRPLIPRKDMRQVKNMLLPGDILIKRSKNQLTNIGIPGFWTHTGIYVGGIKEIDAYFAGIPMLKGELPSVYLRRHNKLVYRMLHYRKNYIIEAIGKGVGINPVESISRVDYFAALRTNLGREDQFLSLLKAFEYYRLPYDYLFNFDDDNSIFCSELVYHAFSNGGQKEAIHFELGSVFGNDLLSPNDIALQFCKQDSTRKTFNLVVFYEMLKHPRKIEIYDEAKFRNTTQGL